MNNSHRLRACARLTAIAAAVALGSSLRLLGASGESVVRPVVLKHRVEVIAPFSPSPSRQGVDVTVERGIAPPGDPTDGLVIQRDEWATALDELKLALGQSPVLRPTDPVPPEHMASTPGIRPAFELHARFGRVEGHFRVLLRLVQKPDGALVVATQGRHAEFEKALATAVAGVEKEMLNRPWRCRVTDQVQGQFVIPFGRLDGLVVGQILTGFTMPEDVRSDQPALNDLLLLKSGTKAGHYQVSQVTEELALLRPVAAAPSLCPGDVLEAPAARLQELPRSSASTIWDRIYAE